MATELRYTISDDDGDSAETGLYLPDGDTLARYTEFAIAHAPTLEGITNGLLDPLARITIPIDISGLTGNVATQDSDVERMVQFSFANENGEPVLFNLPGLNYTTLISGSDEVDQTDVSIAPIITAFEDGLPVTGATAEPCDIGEADIVATYYARKHIKNSGSKA